METKQNNIQGKECPYCHQKIEDNLYSDHIICHQFENEDNNQNFNQNNNQSNNQNNNQNIQNIKDEDLYKSNINIQSQDKKGEYYNSLFGGNSSKNNNNQQQVTKDDDNKNNIQQNNNDNNVNYNNNNENNNVNNQEGGSILGGIASGVSSALGTIGSGIKSIYNSVRENSFVRATLLDNNPLRYIREYQENHPPEPGMPPQGMPPGAPQNNGPSILNILSQLRMNNPIPPPPMDYMNPPNPNYNMPPPPPMDYMNPPMPPQVPPPNDYPPNYGHYDIDNHYNNHVNYNNYNIYDNEYNYMNYNNDNYNIPPPINMDHNYNYGPNSYGVMPGQGEDFGGFGGQGSLFSSILRLASILSGREGQMENHIDPQELNQIMEVLPSDVINGRVEGNDTNCVICLGDFQQGESVTTLPCLHRFHTDCIRSWLQTKNDCPVCKHVITLNSILGN